MLCQLLISDTHFLDRQAEPQRSNKERETSRVARPAGPLTGLPGVQEACGTLRAAPNQSAPASPKAPASSPPPGPLSQDQTAAAAKPRRTLGGSLSAELAAPAPVPSGTLLATCGRLRHAPVPPPPPAGIHVPRRVGGPASRGKVLRRLQVQLCAIAPGTFRRAGLRALVTEPRGGGGGRRVRPQGFQDLGEKQSYQGAMTAQRQSWPSHASGAGA